MLADTVRPESVGDHAATDRSSREGRLLAMGHRWSFPRSQTGSNLPFLFLLPRLATVLLRQLVVVNFREGAHRSVALALLLSGSGCVRTEEARKILWCSPWPRLTRGCSLAPQVLRMVTQLSFLNCILQLLAAALRRVYLIRARDASSRWHGSVLLIWLV